MQFSEVNEIFETNWLVTECIVSGKTPEEIVKAYLKNKSEIELWNRAHCEYGKLTDVHIKDAGNSYTVEVEFESNKVVRGSNQRTVRSRFIEKTEENRDKIYSWRGMIGDWCLFYVTYTENKKDGSVFRTLLDIEQS